MIPHTGVTREIMENIDPHDTMACRDILKAINVTTRARLFNSRETNREAKADIETTRTNSMTLTLTKSFSLRRQTSHDGITNIHILIHPYAICHVSDVAAHNIHLQIENLLRHLNKPTRT